jgi:hypothetical protein
VQLRTGPSWPGLTRPCAWAGSTSVCC